MGNRYAELDKHQAILDNQQKNNKIRNLIYAISKRVQVSEYQETKRNPILEYQACILDEH